MKSIAAALLLLVACESTPSPRRRAPASDPTPPSPSGSLPSSAPVTTAAQRAAIGDTDDPAFAPGDDFPALPEPGPGDWLAVHREPGQTYAQYVASNPNLPAPHRRTIYLVPLGSLSADLEVLEAYTRAFYGLPVAVHPPIEPSYAGARGRTIDGQQQLYTGDILRYLETITPDDAYAVIALTDIDLYPGSGWNFVFGQATLKDRVGVYSFARYGDRDPKVVLRRSLKVLSHEVGHMFGIEHCVHFLCGMNGVNSLEESDSRPPHLCPVCLRKLHHSAGFDIVERYRRLAAFYREHGLDDEAGWVEARLAAIARGPADDTIVQ